MKSTSFSERIAIIEFDSSHDECLMTQINALKKSGCWVLLITNDILRKRNQHLESTVDDWRSIDPKGKGLRGAAIGDALIIRRLMRSLKTLKVDKVIFNTGQGGHVRNACLFSLFRKIEFIGIIHTTRKFQGSFTQKVISLKIKKYLVLAEFLREQIPPQKRIKFETFYPLEFPNADLPKLETDQLHVSLIGAVETRRKDLDGFVSFVQQFDSSVQFHFLGKADPSNSEVIKLKKNLEKTGGLGRVNFYDDFIKFKKFDLILRKSCAILPLIHLHTPSADEYFKHQIPGSMIVALAYKIPLLLPIQFNNITELTPASCYYEANLLTEPINEFSEQLLSIHKEMKLTKAYSISRNHKQYVRFVFS